jgi:hypothetical protein
LLVAVNFSPHPSQCYVQLPFAEIGDGAWRLRDVMSDDYYEREGRDLVARGLYLDVPAWHYHAFVLEPMGRHVG